MTAERGGRTDGHRLRYAQCWEDADVLLEALDIQPGHVCLSIASGGDNTLAMLSRSPERVIAVDRNPAQIACLELKVAAYRLLEYEEVRELLGSLPSCRRERLYRGLRPSLSADARRFWDARPEAIAMGIGEAGKFEGYFRLFRSRVLPLIHSRERVAHLLLGGPRVARGDLLRCRLGHPAVAAHVPRLLLPPRHGPSGPRSRLLPATSRATSRVIS